MKRRYSIGFAGIAISTYLLIVGCGPRPGASEFDRGLKAFAAEDYVAARTHFEKSITRRPGSPENARAYNLIGACCWRLGEPDQAVQAFESSRNLDATSAEPVYNLGVLTLEQSNDTRAASFFREASLLDEKDPRPLEFLAHIEQQRARWPEAAEALRQALEREPGSPRILCTLALVELQAEGPEEAMLRLQEAVRNDPTYAPAYLNLAAIYQRWVGDEEAVRHNLQRYLDHGTDPARRASAAQWLADLDPPPPEWPDPPVVPPAETAAAPDRVENVEMAEVPDPTGEGGEDALPPEEVEPAPREAETSPQERRPPREERSETVVIVRPPSPRTVNGWLSLARQHARRGHTEQVLDACRRAAALARESGDLRSREYVARTAVELCPDQAVPHYDLGLVQLEQGLPENALRSFKQAVAYDPTWATACLALAESAVRTGEFDAAFVALRRALRVDPDNAEALWGLATLYDYQLKLPGHARDSYREFLQQFPGDRRASRARERLRQLPIIVPEPEEDAAPPAAAVPSAAAARPVSASPPPASARNRQAAIDIFNRGTIYQARRNWDQAIQHYLQAVEQDPTFAVAYYNLGRVYDSQRQAALAENAYRQAVKHRPDLANARYNLAILLQDRGDKQGAVEQLTAILRMDPSHAKAHYLLGLIYAGDRASWQLAASHYRSFLRLAPTDPAAAPVRRWLAAPR